MDAIGLSLLVNSTFNKINKTEKFDNGATTSTSTATTASTPAAVLPAVGTSVSAPGVGTISTPTPQAAVSKFTAGSIFGFIFMFIFIIVFGAYAAYLSWKSNSLIEWGTGWKILFSIFAFMAGFSYLISYLIYKADLVAYINRSKGLSA